MVKVRLSEIRKDFIDLRAKTNELDSHFSYFLVINTVVFMYSVMISIYILSIVSVTTNNISYVQVMFISTLEGIIQMTITCFVCGSVHEKSKQIYAILDEFNANDLSDSEFKDWVMFNTISEKTPFWFTIGGFAPLRKTTLLSVRNSFYNYLVND